MAQPRLTDSHCHLEQLEDPQAALKAALNLGVHRIVAVAETEASLDKIQALRCENVLAGVGFHPMFTPDRDAEQLEAALQRVEALVGEADVVGEIGLDHKYAKTDEEQEVQREVLRRQLKLAAKHGKPINLHSRWALRETMNFAIDFANETGLGAQLHWFTQSKKLVRKTNQAGVYVSVGPSILLSDEAAAVAALVNRDLLLLETDGPVPFDGESAEPSWIPRVAQRVAELWQCDLAEVSRQTEINFERYLGK